MTRSPETAPSVEFLCVQNWRFSRFCASGVNRMKGRKPLPTEIKELQGTLQPCRTNYQEPKVRQKICEKAAPPETLSDEAKVHWNFVLEHEGAGWIKQCDRGMFEQYCELWAEITKSRKEKRRSAQSSRNFGLSMRKLLSSAA